MKNPTAKVHDENQAKTCPFSDDCGLRSPVIQRKIQAKRSIYIVAPAYLDHRFVRILFSVVGLRRVCTTKSHVADTPLPRVFHQWIVARHEMASTYPSHCFTRHALPLAHVTKSNSDDLKRQYHLCHQEPRRRHCCYHFLGFPHHIQDMSDCAKLMRTRLFLRDRSQQSL